ncbi:MAG: NAD(P)/FAD-dependent oxidoreductase [Verrucomicrobiales bacterium]|nr:NAD(P)/FAD-dependent oxidoreductase [Verrucomicrobiales bacterium]
MGHEYDSVIIGSGPNGLAAAITLAKAGQKVLVVEKYHSPGGGVRSEAGTLPGVVHDLCSAIYPMAVCSPFFESLSLESYGVGWIDPEIPLAHPFDDGSAAVMNQSLEETVAQFSTGDARSYRRIFEPLLESGDNLFRDLLAPPKFPSDPIAAIRFGMTVLPSAKWISRTRFSGEEARALFAGNAAHSVLPLDRPLTTGAIGIMLMLACHRKGWPIVKGGAGVITDALVKCLEHHGGVIKCDWEVTSLDELPSATNYLFDTGPQALAAIAGDRLPRSFCDRLNRYRYGPGVFKIDYTLSGPVPWKAQACRKAGTVHIGGTFDEIAAAEKAPWLGQTSEKPFVLTAQPSLFDSSRAPSGQHTFWAYCHVPANSTVDMTAAIERQIERFAPGFRDTILSRQTRNCAEFQSYNPNFVGGDVIGGVTDWRQLLTRPVARLKPHTTPADDIFLCSASTPPGGGVHGMCGYWAAQEVLNSR